MDTSSKGRSPRAPIAARRAKFVSLHFHFDVHRQIILTHDSSLLDHIHFKRTCHPSGAFAVALQTIESLISFDFPRHGPRTWENSSRKRKLTFRTEPNTPLLAACRHSLTHFTFICQHGDESISRRSTNLTAHEVAEENSFTRCVPENVVFWLFVFAVEGS